MVAKIILPNLGGSPSVWTVCLLFFQATLLLGYAYTHLATSNLGVRRRSSVHALLILLPLAILPISDWLDLSLPLILGSLTGDLILVLQFNPLFPTQLTHIIVFGLAVILCLSFAKHRVRFALGLAALLVTSASYTGPYGRLLETKRSFFGVYRVMLDKTEKYHLLLHGNTVHGMQSLVPDRRHEPLSYYSANGPIGQIFALRSRENGDSPPAIVGLGTGSLACYGHPGRQFVFYEIDPLVELIARDRRDFTFLENCRAQTTVVLGDARISLKGRPPSVRADDSRCLQLGCNSDSSANQGSRRALSLKTRSGGTPCFSHFQSTPDLAQLPQ